VHLFEESWHHLLRVRRVRNGESILLGDGAGGLLVGEVRLSGSRKGSLEHSVEPLGEVYRVPPPVPTVGVASYLPSNDRLSYLVQKTVESGVDEIFLVRDPKGSSGTGRERAVDIERLQRIVREASGQAKRAYLPKLGVFESFEALFDECGGRMALCAGDGGPPSLRRTLWLIGPESGRVLAPSVERLPRVCISTEVLRIETASVVAGALLVALRSSLVAEVSR
jgi:16S rRNA (uracil1498-N3)-methyltransferase